MTTRPYDSRYICSRCGHRSALEHLRGECFECNDMGGVCAYSDLRTNGGERAERIAQAIDRKRFHMGDCICVICAAYRCAARIARESRT